MRYKVRLVIRHPSLSPHEISESLNLTPTITWERGALRRTPKGNLLSGTYAENMWNLSIDDRKNKNIDNIINELLESLSSKTSSLQGIVISGGKISLFLDLPGHSNTGISLSAGHLALLASCGLNLGIEVFPDI